MVIFSCYDVYGCFSYRSEFQDHHPAKVTSNKYINYLILTELKLFTYGLSVSLFLKVITRFREVNEESFLGTSHQKQ